MLQPATASAPNVLGLAVDISDPLNWYFNVTERNLTWSGGGKGRWCCAKHDTYRSWMYNKISKVIFI